MSWTRPLLLLAVLACAGFAPAPFPKPERKKHTDDLAAMQGSWKLVRYESNGKPMTSNFRVRIDKNVWNFVNLNQGRETSTASYELRLAPKLSPRGFEWKSTGRVSSQYCGSYVLDRDKLMLVFNSGVLDGATPRPMDFKSNKGYLLILEREKP
jgi:uncharacterized protein (TIGR03067 family)